MLVEARKLTRTADRGPKQRLRNLEFTIEELLFRLPVQEWPLPGLEQCLNVRCDEFPNRENMQEHLKKHKQMWTGGIYSECSVIIASMLGVSILKEDANQPISLVCPIQGCDSNFEDILSVDQHIQWAHQEFSEQYKCLGPFWLAVANTLRVLGRWPTLAEMGKMNIDYRFGTLDRKQMELMWEPVGRKCAMPKRIIEKSIIERMIGDLWRYASEEGIDQRAYNCDMRIWNAQGAMPQEQRENAIREELQQQVEEWMSHQQEIQEKERDEILKWNEGWQQHWNKIQSEKRMQEIKEQEEEQKRMEAKEWVEASVREDARRRLEEENGRRSEENDNGNGEDGMEFWMNEQASQEEIEVSEHEEIPTEVDEKRRKTRSKEVKSKGRTRRKKRIDIRENDPFLEIAKQWPIQVERAKELTDILLGEELETVKARLEDILEKMRDDPIPDERKRPQTLDDPVLIVLVQNECHQICRSEIFCPEYNKRCRSQSALMQHIKNQHALQGETVKCPDSIRYFIARMFSEIRADIVYGRWEQNRERMGSGKMSFPWLQIRP
jgi:hypothetical protein